MVDSFSNSGQECGWEGKHGLFYSESEYTMHRLCLTNTGMRAVTSVLCRVVMAVSGFLLIGWCAVILLPCTLPARAITWLTQRPFVAIGLAGDGAYCHDIWQAVSGVDTRYSLANEVASMVIVGFVIWRCGLGDLLAARSFGTRLVSAAFLSLVFLSFADFMTSSAEVYAYSDQARSLLCIALVVALATNASSGWWRFLINVVLACVLMQATVGDTAFLLNSGPAASAGAIPGVAGTFGNQDTMYPLCMIGSVLLFAVFLGERRTELRWLYGFFVFVMITTLLLTFSTPGILGLFAGLLWLVVRDWRSKRFQLLIVVGLVLIVGVTMRSLLSESPGMSGGNGVPYAHTQCWHAASLAFVDSPLFGVGQDQCVGMHKASLAPDAQSSACSGPVNLYLGVAAEHGVIGVLSLVLIACATGVGCSTLTRVRRGEWESRVVEGTVAAGVAILAASMVDTPVYSLHRFPGTFVFLVCLGFLMHLQVRDRSTSGTFANKNHRLRAGVAAAVVLALVAASIIVVGALDAWQAGRSFDEKVIRIRRSPYFVSLERMPKTLLGSVLADEDGGFYGHPGFSMRSKHRALRVNLRAGRVKQGGSTITEQLAKCLFFSRNRSIRRKSGEFFAAIMLERRLTKREILELYLNTIDFGFTEVQGIGMSAKRAFGKQPEELTDAECAVLAGVIPYHPEDSLTRKRAQIGLRRTMRQLSDVDEEMWKAVQSEVAKTGQDSWVRSHVRDR